MGLFLCDLCEEQLTLEEHVCDKDKILKRIEKLERRAIECEIKSRDMTNTVFKMLQDIPSLDSEEITISTEWLRNLWKVLECQWHKSKTADDFLVCSLAMQRILIESFDVFRSIKYGKRETILEKLKNLREACDNANNIFGYNATLDLVPEDLI